MAGDDAKPVSDPLAEAFVLLATTKPVKLEDPAHVYHSFRETFDSPPGRRVLAWMWQESGSLSGNDGLLSDDQARFNAGKRCMAQWILALYASAPAKPKPEPKPVSPLDRRSDHV